MTASIPSPQSEWLSLTDLGRLHGISAVHCGRILCEAGLRLASGAPSHDALHRGLALQPLPRRHNRSALWHRHSCGALLERQGLRPLAQQRLIRQWADLLEALLMGANAVSVSVEEMAGEMPPQLRRPVNQELRQRGSSLRLTQPSRRASACRAALSSSWRS
ncbi:MAG: hypothetical protein MUD04_10355 [Cyanobium sp. Prado107]|jgi:hypothetical protein|nr:hypothetical protein [Cyanobium sp. Prado107]